MIIIPPFRLKIIIAICDIIKTITPGNGYQMDLADEPHDVKHVVRGKLFLGDDEPNYIVSVLEPPTAVEPQKSGVDNQKRANEWDILIQGWAKNDDDNEPGDLAYVLAADVMKALSAEVKKTQTGRPGAPNMLGMGSKITEMRIGTPVTRPTEDVTDYAVFYLILTLKIVEDMASPLG